MSWYNTLMDSVKGVAPSIIGTAANTLLPGSGGVASNFVESLMRDVAGDQDSDIDKVAETIMADPGKALEFKKAMAAKEVELAKVDAEIIKNANDNTTSQMVSEGKSERWPQYSWRPWCGFWFPPAAVYSIYNGNNINTVVLSIVFTMWGSILGVSAYQRGKAKREETGNVAPGLVKMLTEKILK